MKKNLSEVLERAIKNREPLKIWVTDTYMGIYKYENNKYQGEIGYLELEDLIEGIKDGWITADIGGIKNGNNN